MSQIKDKVVVNRRKQRDWRSRGPLTGRAERQTDAGSMVASTC
jgi:hypothetical protein